MRIGPQTEAADRLHAEKYRLPGESFRDAMNRIASAMSDSDVHYHKLRDILLSQRFLPAGRIQSAMGSGRQVTAFNCFVSGTISDVMTGNEASIMGRQMQAIETLRRGGGIGYDFSTIRPRGAPITKLESIASGPVSFMHGYHAWAEAVSSTGHRRGAQMGVLRIDHPDIEEFIRAKQTEGKLTTFNISVGVTDAFMHALEADEMFPLMFERRVYREVRARDLWEQIMRCTWDYADPGVLFIDRINVNNNLKYCETIAATNPCGEQPLPPFGACLLGSFNWAAYVGDDGFDDDQWAEDIPVIVRAMDNVIDRTTYPLIEQEHEAKSKRRMGLGVTGVANAIEALGHPYGSDEFLRVLDERLEVLANAAYTSSAQLAAEKGAFPRYDAAQFSEAPYVQWLNSDTQKAITEHGLRNSHLISIAPTGTISQCADNVSSGIEPTFALSTKRIIQTDDGPRDVVLQDYAHARDWCHPTTFDRVSVDDHLKVLAVASAWVDSGVSKTINLPNTVPWDEFKSIYTRAYKLGIKGVTTFVMGNAKGSLLEVAEAQPDTCVINEMIGERDCG
ncbi:MAG: adenosylcobalamin-dependent ribonucleoside-diphosphate reductase [Pseudomonadota bacterium]